LPVPRHFGLFWRRAGSEPGFAYSDAMRVSDIVCTARTLDRSLSNPTKVIPGTTMAMQVLPTATSGPRWSTF
jgi:cytochrome c